MTVASDRTIAALALAFAVGADREGAAHLVNVLQELLRVSMVRRQWEAKRFRFASSTRNSSLGARPGHRQWFALRRASEGASRRRDSDK